MMTWKSLSAQSAWDADRVNEFLETYTAPLRLSVVDSSGFPLICSLWFRYEAGRLRCATQSQAHVVRCLLRNPKCAFELATNEPPYHGVRGRGLAKVADAGADELLGRLVDRYVGRRDSKFARWLLGRAEDEVIIEIEIDWLTSWDYSHRMSESNRD